MTRQKLLHLAGKFCHSLYSPNIAPSDFHLFQSLQNSLNITVIQVYALTSNTEEAEVERFCEDAQDLLELTPQNDVLFIIGNWNV